MRRWQWRLVISMAMMTLEGLIVFPSALHALCTIVAAQQSVYSVSVQCIHVNQSQLQSSTGSPSCRIVGAVLLLQLLDCTYRRWCSRGTAPAPACNMKAATDNDEQSQQQLAMCGRPSHRAEQQHTVGLLSPSPLSVALSTNAINHRLLPGLSASVRHLLLLYRLLG